MMDKWQFLMVVFCSSGFVMACVVQAVRSEGDKEMMQLLQRKFMIYILPIPIILIGIATYDLVTSFGSPKRPPPVSNYDIRVHDTYLTYDNRAVTVSHVECWRQPHVKCKITYFYSDEDSDMLMEDRFNAMVRERVNRIDKRK